MPAKAGIHDLPSWYQRTSWMPGLRPGGAVEVEPVGQSFRHLVSSGEVPCGGRPGDRQLHGAHPSSLSQGHARGCLTAGHALGRLTQGSLRVSRKPAPAARRSCRGMLGEADGCMGSLRNFAKLHPRDRARRSPGAHPPGAFPAAGACPGGRVVAQFRKTTSAVICACPSPDRAPPCRTRREGCCAISQKPRPPRPVPVLPRVVAPDPCRDRGGRVVAQFRKNHVRRDLCPSFPGSRPRPVPNPAGGSLRNFAKPRPPRPVPVLPRVVPPPGSNPAGGLLRNFANPRPPRPVPVLPRVVPARADSAGGACPGGRVVAQFRKNHVRRDLCPSFPGSCPARAEPGGRSLPRREGRCAISQKPRPPRPVPVLPRVVPARAEPGGGACPGGRVVARFRKNHVRRDLCPSFPGSCPRPCRTRREGRCAISQKPRPPRPVPVLPRVVPPPVPNPAGGSLRNFAKTTSAVTCARPSRVVPPPVPNPARSLPRREGRCAISQKPRPPRPVLVLPRVVASASAGAPREAPFCPSVLRQRAAGIGTANTANGGCRGATGPAPARSPLG